MTTHNEAAFVDPCCPVTLGDVCWDDGVNTGQAFAIYNPVTQTTTFTNKADGSVVDPADIVACESGGISNVSLTCDDAASARVPIGANLLVNGNMSQSVGIGPSSIAGPGWTTSYTVPSGGNLFIGAGAGAATWMYYDTSNIGTVFNGLGNPQLLPIGGGKAIGVNIGPNTSVPIIQWANIYLENGKSYNFSFDGGAVGTQSVDVKVLVDGVTQVAALPSSAMPVNVWSHVDATFNWAGTTGYHAVGLYSNSGAGGGNDGAFDNFVLRQVDPAVVNNTTTPVEHEMVVRALVEQIVRVIGCNDDRRDTLLAQVLSNQSANQPVTGNGTLTRATVTANGSVAAGMYSVDILNVGTTDATVLGAILAPGERYTATGYYDEAARNFVRLPAIAYTASATAILRVATQT